MTAELAVVALDRIEVGANHRRHFNRIDELAESIRRVGLVEPIVVAATDAASIELIAGERRLRACRVAGLTEVACMVHRGLDDRERAELMFVENFHRDDLNPIEEAEALAHMRGLGVGVRELANRLACSPMHVSRRLSLLTLPDEVQDRVENGEMSVTAGYALAKLVDHPKRLQQALAYSGPLPLETIVANHLAAIDNTLAVEKAVKKLNDEGVAVVEWPAEGDFKRNDADQVIRPLGGQGHRQSIDVDVETHAGERCHAATVEPRTARVIWICLEAERHTPVEQALFDEPRVDEDPIEAPAGAEEKFGEREVDGPAAASPPVPAGNGAAQEPPAPELPDDVDWTEPSIDACRVLLLNPQAADVDRFAAEVWLRGCADYADVVLIADLLQFQLELDGFVEASVGADDLPGNHPRALGQLLDIAANGTGRDSQRLLFALAMSAGETLRRRGIGHPTYGRREPLTDRELAVVRSYIALLELADYEPSTDELYLIRQEATV